MTPAERSLRARLAAHCHHAQVDSRDHTEPARRAFMDRFEDEVDPDRVLPTVERQRRAEQAEKAYSPGRRSGRSKQEGEWEVSE